MRYTQDIAGKKFGSLTALHKVGTADNGAPLWLFRCECGGEEPRRLASVRFSAGLGFNPTCKGCLAAKRDEGEDAAATLPEKPLRQYVPREPAPFERQPDVSPFTSILCRMGLL